jgi:hypothetical protein
MRAFLEFIDAFLWAAFLDENEWWIKGAGRADPFDGHVNPGRH